MSENKQAVANQRADDPASEPIDPQARIGHIHLNVADLDRAITFYQTVLGLQVSGSSAFVVLSNKEKSARVDLVRHSTST